ncbi:TonB-dependent receptor [Methylobacillus arboreus]|uniref:TonB-dependent receptor domain-containing protein n=1 Tax=Methylobacillus arboreus TaxID=755170 RepID=UPI001E29763A|nr:TonB-dependent receptor [Methylobacillus arboreus]MCB5189704.1 TonB-dependent receptor [Methylobacillus arboreus]
MKSPMHNDRLSSRQLSLALVVIFACTVSYAKGEESISSPPSTIEQQKSEASTTATSSNTQSSTVLPEVGVSASRLKQDAVSIDRTRTITTIETKELERTQPVTIFDAIRDVPGVAINGGPRPSGMTFNVRGYNDGEDVLVRVDNVPKGFEKYRFGGTFVEPELLKSIEVQRGPQITSGSGSLGGTVLAKTKDAADLLKPGQRYGARFKFGYASNNDEYQRSYMFYSRPIDEVDILYHRSHRTSNDITHNDGSKLESSAINSLSQLFKLSIFPTDDLQLTTSIILFQDSGLQPYDATGGNPGSITFRNLIREIDDLSISETIRWTPDTPWIDLTATIGKGHTKLKDTSPPGFGLNSSNAAGTIYDDYKYSSSTVDIANTSILYGKNDFNIKLLAGLQYNSMSREVTKTASVAMGNVNSDGFNPAVVAGEKTFTAFYLQPRIEYGRFGIIPGIRVDTYDISTNEPRVQNHLLQKNLPDQISFTHKTYSLGLTFDLIPRSLTIFSNYGQGFRPPSIDEYFSYASNYAGNLLTPPFPGYIPGLGSEYGGGFGRCTTPETNYICGDVYRLQTSTSSEIGLHYQTPRLFDSDLQLISKFTYFHIKTEHLLRSFALNTISVPNVAPPNTPQNAWEKRYGTEFESSLLYKDSYARISYSKTWGSIFEYPNISPVSIYTVPGNALNITLGTQLTRNLGINASYRKISERLIDGGSQDGYEVFNAGAFWTASNNVIFRLVGENLKNKDYNLNAAGDMPWQIGNRAAGRNIRFITEISF